MASQLSRRSFLKHTAAASAISAGYFVAPSSARSAISVFDKLNLGIVGAGNKGWHNVEQLTQENVVAICDVDTRYLDHAAMIYPNARKYRDYRQMLEAEQSRIDAVVVSTADHTHAPATSAALDLGKHAYCEKPLTHTVQEARTIAELAKRNKLATQMGTQVHADENYRRVVEIVQSGLLGPIKEVYCWCSKGWSDGRFGAEVPVPANLDWDLWLGPAKKRAYSENIHPANWRRFWEYGSGTLGDMGCHVIDLAFWAVDLDHPTSVASEGPDVHADGTPAWLKVSYEFPGTAKRGPVKLYWSDGGEHFDYIKSQKDATGKPLPENWFMGVLFVGEKGSLLADYGRREFLPADKFADVKLPAATIAPSVGHWREWTDACKTGSPTLCNFDYAGKLTETVLLGTVAFRAQQKLAWDAAQLKATNCPNADAFIRKEYRKGFGVVGIS